MFYMKLFLCSFAVTPVEDICTCVTFEDRARPCPPEQAPIAECNNPLEYLCCKMLK